MTHTPAKTGQRSLGTTVRVETDRQTDGRTDVGDCICYRANGRYVGYRSAVWLIVLYAKQTDIDVVMQLSLRPPPREGCQVL